MTGIERIAAERQRQIDRWGTDNDLGYTNGELTRAAFSYLEGLPVLWPWDRSTFKLGDRIRNLEKAGALIAAEIDRLSASGTAR